MPDAPRDYGGEPWWKATGKVRIRVGWFGRAIVEEQQSAHFSTRRAGEGYSPSQWQEYFRWVRSSTNAVIDVGPDGRI